MRKHKAKIRPLDIIVFLAILAVSFYLAHRITEDLDYHWDWKTIPQYLFRFDPEKGLWIPNILIQGLFTTIRLSVWGTILATLFGTGVGLALVGRNLFFRVLGRMYVELVRNVPPLVLVFLFYYFLSGQVMTALGADALFSSCSERMRSLISFFIAPPQLFSAFFSGLIALAVFEGAYIAEIVRAGIQSIEKGIWEAASSLGLSRWRQMRYIILPLAVQRILPPLGGQFISTIKDSAIVSIISIQELTFQGMELMSSTYLVFEVWITITVLYLILTLSLSLAVGRLEIYLRRSEA